jgi:hypothetical protein
VSEAALPSARTFSESHEPRSAPVVRSSIASRNAAPPFAGGVRGERATVPRGAERWQNRYNAPPLVFAVFCSNTVAASAVPVAPSTNHTPPNSAVLSRQRRRGHRQRRRITPSPNGSALSRYPKPPSNVGVVSDRGDPVEHGRPEGSDGPAELRVVALEQGVRDGELAVCRDVHAPPSPCSAAVLAFPIRVRAVDRDDVPGDGPADLGGVVLEHAVVHGDRAAAVERVDGAAGGAGPASRIGMSEVSPRPPVSVSDSTVRFLPDTTSSKRPLPPPSIVAAVRSPEAERNVTDRSTTIGGSRCRRRRSG